MNKKRILLAVLSFVFSVMLCAGFSACGGSDEENTESTEETIDYEQQVEEDAKVEQEDEEMDEPILKGLKYEDFIGTWKTTTERADDYFGGYTITFNKDMTFKAIVTGEEETGKCTFENSTVYVQNEVLNDAFQFNVNGTLIVYGENGEKSTLTKQK